jgi:enamine deaminase RidA (YjgF/YER057c/UK114 family)
MQGDATDFEGALLRLGISLPPIPPRAGLFVPAARAGALVFCSGQGPYADGAQRYLGKVGSSLSIEEGIDAARIAALNCLAELRWALGSLNAVRRIAQLRGYVNCAPDFLDQPKVIDGASRLVLSIFGEAGEHARCAIGVASLPGDIAVEIEMVAETRA